MNADHGPPQHEPLARGSLVAEDVAAIFTRERQEEENRAAKAERRTPRKLRPVSKRTVQSFIDMSQPYGRSMTPADRAARGPIRNRYEDKPMPLPVSISGVPYWIPADGETLEDVKEALRLWWHSRRQRPGYLQRGPNRG